MKKYIVPVIEQHTFKLGDNAICDAVTASGQAGAASAESIFVDNNISAK